MNLLGRLAAFGAIGLGSNLGLGFNLSIQAVAQQTQEHTSIALPPPSLSYSTTYLAADIGLFADAGLQVKLEEFAGSGAHDAVVTGRTDWALTTGAAVSRSAQSGQRTLILANLVERPQLEILLKRALAEQGKFELRAPADLRGKLLRGRTIAIEAPGSEPHAFLHFFARKSGLDPDKDMTVTPMSPSEMGAALAAGSIEGYSSALPWTIGPVKNKSAVALASAFTGDAAEVTPLAWSVLATRPEMCKSRKSLCEKMVKVYVEAARILRDEPLRATLVLKKRFAQVPDDVLTASVDAIRRSTPIYPAPGAPSLANSTAFYVKAGMMKPEDALKNYEGLFTAEFVR